MEIKLLPKKCVLGEIFNAEIILKGSRKYHHVYRQSVYYIYIQILWEHVVYIHFERIVWNASVFRLTLSDKTSFFNVCDKRIKHTALKKEVMFLF